MNVQQEQGVGTLRKTTDPETVARVVRLLLKFGWPPSDEDVERWRRKHQQPADLDTAA